MSMLKWASPLDEIDMLRKEIDNAFAATTATNGTGFNPAVEVVEAENAYRLRIPLPGLPTENLSEHIHIDATQKTLTLSGEMTPPELQPGEKALMTQIRYGKFYKQLSFPDGIDPETIEASYSAGMLEIRLPKASASQKRSVQIQVK